MSRTAEVLAAGRLVGDATSGAAGVVTDAQRAAAGRVFGALRALKVPVGPVQKAHDGLAALVHGSVRAGCWGVPRGIALLAAAVRPRRAVPGRNDRGGPTLPRTTVAVVNGLWGDTVEMRYAALSLPLSLRGDDHDVQPTGAALASTYPQAAPRIVIFVHGWCETDESWRYRGRRVDRVEFGARLAADLGVTPLFLRYNTGLRISDNGRRLAELVEVVVAGWPVTVDQVALVGHSMGGLVAHSACHHGEQAGHRWIQRLGHVVSLGTPHVGAPLEKAVNVTASLLAALPGTRPAARLLNLRSVGVKDLRYGARLEHDWSGHDPDELLRDRCIHAPLLAHASYRYLAATFTQDPRHPVGALFGDLMVRVPSASGLGRTRRVGFEPEHGAVVGRVTHQGLLNHPAVYEWLLRWLSEAGPCAA